VTEVANPSTSELHKVWARLEDEQHALASTIERAKVAGAEVELLRERQARLILEINSVVAEIRRAPAHTLEDHLALLDVAMEHEIDLAADISFYGPADFPMIGRLLRALAQQAPGFEFNSLRRWLPEPGDFEQLTGRRRGARACFAQPDSRPHPISLLTGDRPKAC
jgi:hypothetical protein